MLELVSAAAFRMRKVSEIIGLPVMEYTSGKEVKKVRDLMFDDRSQTVVALVVESAGLFHAAQVVPFAAIRSIGQDMVIIDNQSVIRAEGELLEGGETGSAIKGKKVVTASSNGSSASMA